MPQLHPDDRIKDIIVADFGQRIRKRPKQTTPGVGEVKLSKQEARNLWSRMNPAQREKMLREHGADGLLELGRKENTSGS